MAIRFRCPSCDQPIEIDAEWASKPVACPYCRKTVTAPATSTLEPIDDVPVASPMSRELDSLAPAPTTAQHDLGDATVRSPRSSVFGTAALITACVMFLLVLLSAVMMAPYANELLELERQSADFMEYTRATQRLMAPEDGELAVGLVVGAMSSCVAMLAWPVAVVLGIIGIYRSSGRRRSIVALSICGFFLLLQMASFLV